MGSPPVERVGRGRIGAGQTRAAERACGPCGRRPARYRWSVSG